MRRIFLSVLLTVPGMLSGMTAPAPGDPVFARRIVFEIAYKPEDKVTAEDITRFEEALKHVPDINTMHDPEETVGHERSWTFLQIPLISVARRCNMTACRLLLAHKANVNQLGTIASYNGIHPILFAALDAHAIPGKHNLMRLLLDMGAECDSAQLRKYALMWEVTLHGSFKFNLENECILIDEHYRQLVTDEVSSVLSRDPAGIVSEYVVREKLTQPQALGRNNA